MQNHVFCSYFHFFGLLILFFVLLLFSNSVLAFPKGGALSSTLVH